MNKPKYNIDYFKNAKANKTNWIKAIQLVLWEYENNCHLQYPSCCAFCQLVNLYGNCINCITCQCTGMLTYKRSDNIRMQFWIKSLRYIKTVSPNKFKSKKGMIEINNRLHEIDANIHISNK